ncbi:hypothetical protein C496_02782 [Natronorubrum tibetense GA33]|uniref:Uncharacterized protein n=1 Tax=Natronorubrum tibetense GA33 TaxID=1114856 RepID=L9W8Y6_9EURY|nr:hypothetical protein C496_02782 [Natronorubrum tibetense GA33]
MLKVPRIRRPAAFEDLFTVLSVYVLAVLILSAVLENAYRGYWFIAVTALVGCWTVWAVYSVIKRSAEAVSPETK